ncbi:MAG: SDR family oxidoreductase [Cryobacterium sp.]|nr:SDR family oxidoreductase [Cryobacterium sp.]
MSAAASRLAGRTILVTGSGSGIGAALARGFAAESANVVLAGKSLDSVEAMAASIVEAGGVASAVRVDVTSREDVRAGIAHAVTEFGRLDAYFNNVGGAKPMRFLEVTEDDFDEALRLNALSVLIGTQEAGKHFIAQGGGGKVVNTGSVAGRSGTPNVAPYAAAKAAVVSLTQAGARALAPHGVTVNAFAPGVVDTPLWARLDGDLQRMGEEGSGFHAVAGRILLGRPADPDDIVPTAVFLASADSDYITGQVIAVDGGMLLA